MKLFDLIETKYFYKTFEDDVNTLLASARALIGMKELSKDFSRPNDAQLDFVKQAMQTGKVPEIDIAGVHVSESAAQFIAAKQRDGYKFIDSEDEGRNDLLKENERRLALDYEVSPMPEWLNTESLQDYLRKLDKNKVYEPRITSDNVYFALIAYLNDAKPEYQFELGQTSGGGYKYLQWVHTLLEMHNFHNKTEFFALLPHPTLEAASLDIVVQDLNTTIVTITEGCTMYFEDAWTKFRMVPTEMSNGNCRNKEEYKHLFDVATSIINNYVNSRTLDLYSLIQEVKHVDAGT